MTPTSIPVRRLLAAGAFTVAAVAAPLAAMTMSAGQQETLAGPACLAWMGNKEDGKCLSYSNGQPIIGGVPPVAIGAPGSGSPGITTGPLLPGTTINRQIG